jgi:hypothetical protein
MKSEILRPSTEIANGKTVYLPTPVLPAWYEAYKSANQHHPRDTYGIWPLVGDQITKSLVKGEVDLMYVAYSRFTDEQFADLCKAVMLAHSAYGVEAKPKELAGEAGGNFSANYWFHDTWGDVKASVVKVLTYFCSTKHPYDMEIDDINSPSTNSLAYDLRRPKWSIDDGVLDESLELFANSPEYPIALPLVAQMYDAVATVLDTPVVKDLARRRRDRMSPNREMTLEDLDRDYRPTDYHWEIVKRMKGSLDDLKLKAHGMDEASILFLNAVTGNPRDRIIDRVHYTHIYDLPDEEMARARVK